jgi:hypothetical protein
VISFFNKGKSFSSGLPFCIFVTNTIYVIKIEMFEPVSMASYLKFKDITFSIDVVYFRDNPALVLMIL